MATHHEQNVGYFMAKVWAPQKQCASNLQCAVSVASLATAHASSDRRCPVFLDEKVNQEIWIKDGFSFPHA
jgi:hypothetical protein